MVDTSQTPALGYMEMVPRRDAGTLLPIIQQHVHNGTTIWSDEWSAYNSVTSLPGISSHGEIWLHNKGVYGLSIKRHSNTVPRLTQ